jgi:hypothetical protein
MDKPGTNFSLVIALPGQALKFVHGTGVLYHRCRSLALCLQGCGRALSLTHRQRGCVRACFMEKERGREREREKHGEGERETGGKEREREREKQGEGERERERCRICPELFIFLKE